MSPRPKWRGKPLSVPTVDELSDEIGQLRLVERIEPVAVVTGFREWVVFKRDRAVLKHVVTWPGLEETFDGVAVIVRRPFDGVRLMATQRDLEDALLGD